MNGISLSGGTDAESTANDAGSRLEVEIRCHTGNAYKQTVTSDNIMIERLFI